jgi:hypothetical protein
MPQSQITKDRRAAPFLKKNRIIGQRLSGGSDNRMTGQYFFFGGQEPSSYKYNFKTNGFRMIIFGVS